MCCLKIIPGYHAYHYELFETTESMNDLIHNPYSSEHFTMQIGEALSNELEGSSEWSEISDFLVNCKYKQSKYVNTSKDNELSFYQ